jgi:hypothetical protein
MNKNEQPSTPENVWKSMNGEDDTGMDIPFTADQLCAMARSRQRESIWSRRFLLLLLVSLTVGFAYNIFSVTQPWVRLGQLWMFIWTCMLLWRLRRGPRRMDAAETCASYLRREFESKRSGFLDIQKWLFLLIPPILASWRGGGPAIRLRALGIQHSSRLYEVASGPWPFIITGLLLVLIWLAFGLAARKATHELDEISRRTQRE